MLFVSDRMTGASGSIGGTTFSHNSGGLYTRARRVPVNPRTPNQNVVRNAMTTLSSRWSAVLTELQRQSWYDFAASAPGVGPLGTTRSVGGIGKYTANNIPRIQAGLAIIDDAPTSSSDTFVTAPTILTVDGSSNLFVAFNNTDPWAGAVGNSMLVYISRPVSQAVRFFKGPYQFVGRINGAVTPPTSPATLTQPFTGVADTKQFAKLRLTTSDGKLSGEYLAEIVTP